MKSTRHRVLFYSCNFRIFNFVLDTPSRHNQAIACFCARLFVSLAAQTVYPGETAWENKI